MQAAIKAFSGGLDDDGCYHGSTCTLETKAGAVCSGRLHHGFLHGKVEMQFPDKFKFEGFMRENKVCAVDFCGCRLQFSCYSLAETTRVHAADWTSCAYTQVCSVSW